MYFKVILLFGTLSFSESFKITVNRTNMIVVIFDLSWVSFRIFFLKAPSIGLVLERVAYLCAWGSL